MSDNYEKYVNHVVELMDSSSDAKEKGDEELAKKLTNQYDEALKAPQYFFNWSECVKIYAAVCKAVTGFDDFDKYIEE